MRRRQFITLLGGAGVTWPLEAVAQQRALPLVGFLHPASPAGFVDLVNGFRQGLKDAGYVEGENVAIDYRWADNQLDRLPVLASELVQRQVAVIAAVGGVASAVAAKSATTTIPIVFNIGDEPVKLGLVASLSRPGGNITGINFLTVEVATKRLELLRQLAPGAVQVALLVNPSNAAASTESTMRDVEAAARTMRMKINVLHASTSQEIAAAFKSLDQNRPDVLFVGAGAFFTSRRVQLAQLAAFHRVPATYPMRAYAEAGGLMSYGASLMDAYRQVGVYAGRILRGAKAADLPVIQSSKFELVINAETARMLGLTVPPSLLSLADEVIE
jgi:putative ABC transport system substrate-binding protein